MILYPAAAPTTRRARFATLLEEAGPTRSMLPEAGTNRASLKLPGIFPVEGTPYLARGIKEAVSVPVIAGNRINDPAVAEKILVNGSADLVSMGRALIADPDLPRKTSSGKGSIRRCIACNQGCLDAVFTLQEVHCTVNPFAGLESEVEIVPAPKPKKVLVVGGGPAGLEAALTATRRGTGSRSGKKGRASAGSCIMPPVPREKKNLSPCSITTSTRSPPPTSRSSLTIRPRLKIY